MDEFAINRQLQSYSNQIFFIASEVSSKVEHTTTQIMLELPFAMLTSFCRMFQN